jgi:hypothetical protein
MWSMSAPTSVPGLTLQPRREPQLATLGWALRRAALGLLILLVTSMLVAWLIYAGIEPDGAATAGPASQSEYALPQN